MATTQLTLIGDPRPVRAADVPSTIPFASLPAGYVQLMTSWGAGRLAAAFELPDPSDTSNASRFRQLQDVLRVDGPAYRRRGFWPQLADDDLARAIVLGVDRRGFALVVRPPSPDVVLLHPRGHVLEIGSFDAFVESFLLGGGLDRSRGDGFQRYGVWAHAMRWLDVRADLGVPAVHVTREPLARRDLLDALARGDEPAADAALETVLATDVALFALLDLLADLAGGRGGAVVPELRRAYAEQLFRMAKRRAPALAEEIPFGAIAASLARGEDAAPEAVATLRANTILEAPEGMFARAPADPVEAELLHAIAEAPDDAATRLVYADVLEEQGDLARASVVRAAAGDAAQELTPLADAAERGFVAPRGVAPVDGAAQTAAHVAAWRAADPTTSVEPLLARIDALHPPVRQGYALLIARLREPERYGEIAAPVRHLSRELVDSLPQVILALRASDADTLRRAVAIVRESASPEAAPFLLSSMRHRAAMEPPGYVGMLAEAFLAVGGTVDGALVDELLRHLRSEGSRLHAAACRLLTAHAADDRVFLAYLGAFAEAHPWSEQAIAKRRKDPRVRATLSEQLAREEKRALAQQTGRHPEYREHYRILARYLSRLGDPTAKAAVEKYRAFQRYVQRRPI